jgi:hypothetical protein
MSWPGKTLVAVGSVDEKVGVVPRIDNTGAFHLDGFARRTVTASATVWLPIFCGSTGTATVRQVSDFGAPSGQVASVATAADAVVVVVVVGAALVGGSVTGTVVVSGAVVAGRVMVDAGVDAAVLQLVATNVSAMPRHEVTVLQRMGTPVRSWVPPPCDRRTSIRHQSGFTRRADFVLAVPSPLPDAN